MAMKLIKKKAPRGALNRWLRNDEEEAVQNFSRKYEQSADERAMVQNVLIQMRDEALWLQCCCVSDETPALSSANLKGETLYLSSFGHSHEPECPMYRVFEGDDDTTRAGTRKKSGSTKLDYIDFLPKDQSGSSIKSTPSPVLSRQNRTCRKNRPRLARLLLTLIEDSGLNTLTPISPLPKKTSKEWLDILDNLAKNKYFVGNRQLSDIMVFNPVMTKANRESFMHQLESSNAIWPKGKDKVFYQVFMSEKVTRNYAQFTWKKGKIQYEPKQGISINGESQVGNRGPYWVILAYRRSATGELICSEGYAHALFRFNCPVPVDSNLERKTLESIAEVAGWLKGKAGELTLVKPLFDIEVDVEGEKGFVLPDFIIKARMADGQERTVVVETMGYTDNEYCERKTEQHKGMRILGALQTDPPRWPHIVIKAFNKHLYGVIKNL